MNYEKSTGYHDRVVDFAPPSEPPPDYELISATPQRSYPAPQEPIPYPGQQPSTRSPAPQQAPHPTPQTPYPSPQVPPNPTQSSPSPSFSAPPPPPPRTFSPFETITVPTLRHRLADGFSSDLPPSHEQPHPFASHDVTQEDWLAFLGDIRRIMQNTSEERLRETFGAGAGSSSVLGGLGVGGRGGGLAGGLLGAVAEVVSKSMSGGASKAAQEPVSLLIAEWNRNFWNPRNIEVSLILKDKTASSLDPYAAPPSPFGRSLGLCRESRCEGGRRAQKRAERGAFGTGAKETSAAYRAFGTEIVADVHQMLGAKETSAAYRAAADEERYAGKPGWCLVLRYMGPAPSSSYAGGGAASGWATRP